MIKAQNLKGFRDFLPQEAKKREYVLNIIQSMFDLFGFEPIQTPTLEYEEVLLGKYGDEGDQLMYRFEDLGKRKVAMRYDQTVPLARVIAQYQDQIPFPFKRYQMQPVFRAENTQKGRFREFMQCDGDIVGTASSLADSEVIAIAAKTLEKLGFHDFSILINDRQSLVSFGEDLNLPLEKKLKIVTALDKLKKIGRENVLNEIEKITNTRSDAEKILTTVEHKKKTQRLEEIFSHITTYGINPEKLVFSPTLARGLNYYTSTIFEIEIEGYSVGSVCGGGRYDDLIGMFANKQIPAVGFAFGFDRLIEAMEQFGLFPTGLTEAAVLVTIFSHDLAETSLKIINELRANNIASELYLNELMPMEKQLKYANQKAIPWVIIIGPEEKAKNLVALRNMKTREQKLLPLAEALHEIS